MCSYVEFKVYPATSRCRLLNYDGWNSEPMQASKLKKSLYIINIGVMHAVTRNLGPQKNLGFFCFQTFTRLPPYLPHSHSLSLSFAHSPAFSFPGNYIKSFRTENVLSVCYRSALVCCQLQNETARDRYLLMGLNNTLVYVFHLSNFNICRAGFS